MGVTVDAGGGHHRRAGRCRLAMWFVINSFLGTAHIVSSIGGFLFTVVSGFPTSRVD